MTLASLRTARQETGVPGGRLRRRPPGAGRDQWWGYLFVAPQVLGFAAFVLYPLVMVVWYSLHKWNVLSGTFHFVGGSNYRNLTSDPVMPSVWTATGLFALGVVVLNLALALGLALLLNQKLRGTTFFRTLFFSPVVVSLVAWAIVWGFLLQRDGGINGLLRLAGAHGPNWLRQSGTALGSVVVVQVLKNVGLNMVLFLAALQGVPSELYEAAKLDGAKPWRAFRSITLPLISPTMLLTMILTIVGSLQVFATIQVMTTGGPGNSTTVLVYYLYRQAFEYHDLGYASMLGVVLFVIVLALTLLQWNLRKRWVFREQ